jgi:hypothetical protein
MPPDTMLTSSGEALATSAARAAPRRGLAWWRRLWQATSERPETVADLDARMLRDIGWCQDQARRPDYVGAPAHRRPNFW